LAASRRLAITQNGHQRVLYIRIFFTD
jgi:hypothetical protein